jgi:hypothetical protein
MNSMKDIQLCENNCKLWTRYQWYAYFVLRVDCILIISLQKIGLNFHKRIDFFSKFSHYLKP